MWTVQFKKLCSGIFFREGRLWFFGHVLLNGSFVGLNLGYVMRVVQYLTSKTWNSIFIHWFIGLPWWLRWWRVCLQCRRPGFNPWVRKIPWRRAWQAIPVFLPGESHRQRSLEGYSPGCQKELDTTEGIEQLVVQTVKNPPAMQGTQVQSLGWEDPLEKEMATHFPIPAWKIPWQRSLVGYTGVTKSRTWLSN